jgi:hypothetical protein
MIAFYVNVIPRNPVIKKVTIMATNLHDVNTTCGIDSDAGMSISTLAEDFLWLDKTPGTLSTLAAPAGINGGSSEIGGVGPMIVRAHSGEFLIDPNGVYLQGSENQPNFRVMATQRLKACGVRSVGCFNDSEDDVLQDRVKGRTIKLDDEGPPYKSILVLKTVKFKRFPVTNVLRQLVKDIKAGNRTAIVERISDADLSNERIPMMPDVSLQQL